MALRLSLHANTESQVLHLLIKLFTSLPSPDYFSITQCFVYLNDPVLAANLLTSLLHLSPPNTPLPADHVVASNEAVLTAYQIAFDLAETATQDFLFVVRGALIGVVDAPAAADIPTEGTELHRQRIAAILTGEESIKLYLEFLYRNNHSDLLILKGTKASPVSLQLQCNH